jgi:hypothetical protein
MVAGAVADQKGRRGGVTQTSAQQGASQVGATEEEKNLPRVRASGNKEMGDIA